MRLAVFLLFCCMICSCQQERAQHYSAFKDEPFQLQECHSWDDLLAQPLIRLNENSCVRLGIQRSAVDELGMVQLLCLEIADDLQAAQRTDCKFDDNLGPFDVQRDDLLICGLAFERMFEVIEQGMHYQLHTFYVCAGEHGLGDNGSGSLAYKNQILAQWYHEFREANFSWFCLFESAQNRELEAIEEGRPRTLDAQSPVCVAYPGSEELSRLFAADEKTLRSKLFPMLFPEFLGKLQVQALPGQKFLFKDRIVADNYDPLSHLLLKIWVNGVLLQQDQLKEPEGFKEELQELMQENFGGLELTVDCSQWDLGTGVRVQDGDKIQIQFLYNIHPNKMDFAVMEMDMIEDACDYSGPTLLLSEVLELQY
ncbi:MAG: hypothetical protein HRU15_13190 [Planctomycetes bacterium]|nr:hypothetical protein [Planctomycetota bacterium]